MTKTQDRTKVPGPEYVTRMTFEAPQEFCFDWCTDYSPKDAALEGEKYLRRVIERRRDRVVFEDLAEMPAGWSWARYEVTLNRPRGWHMESVGIQRTVVGDYTLTPVNERRTRFELRYRRRPGLLAFRRVPKSERDPQDARMWRKFKRALERDYRASLRRRPALRSGRR